MKDKKEEKKGVEFRLSDRLKRWISKDKGLEISGLRGKPICEKREREGTQGKMR